MGFLFDMLEKASGQNCQATNFLKTFSGLSQAQSFGLLEEHSPDTALTIMIQNFNRFLLDKIATDYRQVSPSPNHMEQALATAAVSHIRCSGCYHESVRPGNSYLHELFYSAKFASKSPGRGGAPTFSQVLKESVEHQHQTRAWCDRCKRYQPLTTKKSIQGVPPVLMINAAVQSDAAKQLWATPNWLPQEIGIILDGGHFFCYEGQDIKSHLERGIFDMKVYELIGVVADVNSGEHQKPHLVSMINGKSCLESSISFSSTASLLRSNSHLSSRLLPSFDDYDGYVHRRAASCSLGIEGMCPKSKPERSLTIRS